MKKFYALLAAATCIAGVSAANPVRMASTSCSDVLVPNRLEANLTSTEYAPALHAPAGEWASIGEGLVSEGLVCDITDELGVMSGDTWAVDIEQSQSDPTWYRTIIYNSNSPAVEIMMEPDTEYFYFNVSDPEKVYSEVYKLYASQESGFEVYQLVTETGVDQMLADKTSPTYQAIQAGAFYGKFKDGVVTFPKGAFFNLDRDAGMFYRIDIDGEFAIALPGHQLPVVWNKLGTTTFKDGILGAMFVFTTEDQDPETAKPQVLYSQTEVEENVANPGVFRFVTPWLEHFQTNKRLTIDMTDPTAGIVEQQSTGVVDNDMGLTYLISRSINYAGNSPLDAFKNDKASYPKYAITYNAETRELFIPGNACFYYWPNTDSDHFYSTKSELPVTIDIPQSAGVSNVVVADENAPVEFYNLQGVRVNNPETGLYIVRQGNKVSKVIIRK